MEPTQRTKVRRLPERGAYDQAIINSILDAAFICHVGFVHDGVPVVIPTLYARAGDRLYLHGSPASRMLRLLARGAHVCVTVTLVDGLVLARSAFHHSINYRSVVVFGEGRAVDDPAEKMEALNRISEQLIPGRWAEVRPPSEQELKATAVIAVAISESSAKLRVGPPVDDEKDYSIPVWAGVLPLRTAPESPVPDLRVPEGIEPGRHVLEWGGGGKHR